MLPGLSSARFSGRWRMGNSRADWPRARLHWSSCGASFPPENDVSADVKIFPDKEFLFAAGGIGTGKDCGAFVAPSASGGGAVDGVAGGVWICRCRAHASFEFLGWGPADCGCRCGMEGRTAEPGPALSGVYQSLHPGSSAEDRVC